MTVFVDTGWLGDRQTISKVYEANRTKDSNSPVRNIRDLVGIYRLTNILKTRHTESNGGKCEELKNEWLVLSGESHLAACPRADESCTSDTVPYVQRVR